MNQKRFSRSRQSLPKKQKVSWLAVSKISKYPILLLHGALGSLSQLNPLKSRLEESGNQVFSMNFSGHSGEPFTSETFGIETFANDILKFLERNELAKVNIMGYSMGGYVALWLAKNHSNRVSKIVTLGTKFDWDLRSADNEVKKLDPEKILEKVPSFVRILEHRHAPNDWKELIRKTSEMMLQLGSAPLLTEEILKTIKTPTLICLGDSDDMADRTWTEKVASTLPHGKYLQLNDTAHPIEKVRLDELQKILMDFF